MSDQPPTDFDITATMIVLGGSFVSGLGRLWRQADQDNRATLKAAFPHYWVKYRELARLKAEQTGQVAP